MIEIKLNENMFLRAKETLTRMGVANNRDKVLYQSCHILQKQGKYFIVHFKDMMALDGKQVNISDEDKLRTFSIAKTLETWGILEVLDDIDLQVTNNFRVIKAVDKVDWTLKAKYKIGN